LRRFDAALELYWHPFIARWVLYRVTHRGPAPSSDVLTKEWVIQSPSGAMREPGFWLIDWLRRQDKTEGGRYHHEYATRRWVADMERQEREREAAWEAKAEEVSQICALELEKYATRGRRSQTISSGTQPKLKRRLSHCRAKR
jgi:hypothetical protein